MNICVVSQQVKKTFSGVGLYTHNFVNHLLKDGHKVWVITSMDQSPEGDLPYTLISVPSPLIKKNQARWIDLSFHFARALKNLEKQVPLDCVHFTDARESFFYRTNLPVVGNINDTYSAELHSLSYYRRHYADWLTRCLYYSFVHFVEGIALCRLNAVIANSQFTASTILEQYRVKPQNLFVCHKSVNADLYRPARETLKMQEGCSRKILFVGTNMQRKGLPAIIHAAPLILKEFPETEFWIVGEDKSIPVMKQICAQEAVLDAFHFMGWKSQAELAAIYAQSDLFMMPSLTEAFGVVFLEAMAAGLVVVSARVGGIPEIIQHEKNGLLVDNPEDPIDLANQVKRLFRDPQFYRQLQKEGLATAESFNVQRMVACTYKVYQDVSGQPAPG
jgi:glycosyltransferase involved in cell wall biosynthesis